MKRMFLIGCMKHLDLRELPRLLRAVFGKGPPLSLKLTHGTTHPPRRLEPSLRRHCSSPCSEMARAGLLAQLADARVFGLDSGTNARSAILYHIRDFKVCYHPRPEPVPMSFVLILELHPKRAVAMPMARCRPGRSASSYVAWR